MTPDMCVPCGDGLLNTGRLRHLRYIDQKL